MGKKWIVSKENVIKYVWKRVGSFHELRVSELVTQSGTNLVLKLGLRHSHIESRTLHC